MNNIKDNQSDNNIDPRFDEILSDLQKRQVASAASGAALVEKARIIAKQLQKNNIEQRVAALEKQTTEDLTKATSEEIKSLSEN